MALHQYPNLDSGPWPTFLLASFPGPIFYDLFNEPGMGLLVSILQVMESWVGAWNEANMILLASNLGATLP